MEMTWKFSVLGKMTGAREAGLLAGLAGLSLLAGPAGEPGRLHRTAAVTASITPSETHQTIEGFGGSLYYYSGWLTAHPNKEEIYVSLFDDLGVDILRTGNTYRPGKAFNPDAKEFASKAEEIRGRPVKVLISSWSPPAELKSNGSETNGGTLAKKDGFFDYEGFADYWIESLDAYADAGVFPDYISIQNEPGYVATWESCELMQTETAAKAGYGKALEAVARKLRDGGYPSKILAPEVLGIGYNLFQNYAKNFDHGLVYGYAHHLYHGGDPKNPDKFLDNMRIMARDYGDKPRFQTEYSSRDADWLNTAWIIHNSLTAEEVSAYLHWSLAWEAGNNAELIQLEFPWDRGRWTTPDGYVLTRRFWAFRQYSRFIDPGWKRVSASCSADSVRISAFISGDGDSLTAVILNLSRAVQPLQMDAGGYTVSSSRAFRTSETDKGAELGSFDPSSPLDLPGRSITTIVLTGAPSSASPAAPHPSGFFLESNLPNPFNSRTLIRFGLARRSDATLRIFDLAGRTVRELRLGPLPEGPHQVGFDADGLSAGLYLVRLETGDGMSVAGRMVLSK
jgi:glucuronoarabinoxylan endo-1,4-beta-xylanase